jgi:hypothetical protein
MHNKHHRAASALRVAGSHLPRLSGSSPAKLDQASRRPSISARRVEDPPHPLTRPAQATGAASLYEHRANRRERHPRTAELRYANGAQACRIAARQRMTIPERSQVVVVQLHKQGCSTKPVGGLQPANRYRRWSHVTPTASDPSLHHRSSQPVGEGSVGILFPLHVLYDLAVGAFSTLHTVMRVGWADVEHI